MIPNVKQFQENLDKTMPFWPLDVKERMEMAKKAK
jgi:hypothetical protein